MIRPPDPEAVAAFKTTERVLDALSRAIVVTDAGAMVVGANRHAEELFGWTAADMVGTDVRAVVRVASNEEADPRGPVLDQILAGGRWEGDIAVVRRDGTTLRVFTAVGPLTDEAGRVVGTVAAAEDVTERRRLQHRAQDLNDHLSLALDAGQLGTWRWDSQVDEVVWDERMEAMFGLSAGQFDGSFDSYVARLHPDDRDHVLATVSEAVDRRGGYQVDHRVVWPDGSVHWIQGRGQAVIGADGTVTGTVGCVSDITTMKEAEAATERLASVRVEIAERERRRHERLEFLAGLTEATLAANSHEEFMEIVTNAAVPRLGDWCALYFIPEPGAPVERRIAHVDPAKVAWVESLAERHPYDPDATTGVPAVIRSGVAEYVPVIDRAVLDAVSAESAIERGELEEILDILSLTSVITVPLTTKRSVIGAIQFVSAESGQTYDADDLSLARAAAGRIAEALDNLWFAEQHRAISAALQRALLPPAVPAIDQVDLAVRYWPAGAVTEVGGDFYDVFELEHDRWAIVIGDVCGTGPNAAAVTSIARHTIRAAARHRHDHTTVLAWLNDAVCNSDRGLFCTAGYATLRRVGDHFDLTSAVAGHPLPLVVRADGRVEALGRPGTLLGVFDHIVTHPIEARLDPGDTVLFYTDGVTDLPAPYGLDEQQLADMATAAASTGSAKETADAIDEFLSDRLPSTRRRDDTALVVLRLEAD